MRWEFYEVLLVPLPGVLELDEIVHGSAEIAPES